MSTVPRIKIKLPDVSQNEYIFELKDAGKVLNFSEGIFILEGQGVHSYDELVHIARQDRFRDKEYLELEWLHMIGGG